MNNKGFAIIETVVVVVVLCAALLMVYTTFSSTILDEKTRLYYDDVSYIYKTNYVKNFILENSELTNYLNIYIKNLNNNANETDDQIAITIGTNSQNLFVPNKLSLYNNIILFYNINRVTIIKPDFEIITQCSDDAINGIKGSLNNKVFNTCRNSFAGVEYSLIGYIRSLGAEKLNNKNYLILISYLETKDGESCNIAENICNYNFAWLDTGISYE